MAAAQAAPTGFDSLMMKKDQGPGTRFRNGNQEKDPNKKEEYFYIKRRFFRGNYDFKGLFLRRMNDFSIKYF